MKQYGSRWIHLLYIRGLFLPLTLFPLDIFTADAAVIRHGERISREEADLC